jgi:hypothetical protein
MTITPTTIKELLDYWPGNIPFKGSLVSEDGTCMCAQGQALHYLGGLTVEDLRSIDQSEADRKTAELFGISRAHAVLLRIVNDNADGAPSCVIRSPEQILGDQAETVLAFWRCLDHSSEAARASAGAAARAAAGLAARAEARAAAMEAARALGWGSAWEAARAAAWGAAWGSDWEAARAAAWGAAWATYEIQGAVVLRAKNQPFFFLPLFGFADPEAVVAADRADRGDW